MPDTDALDVILDKGRFYNFCLEHSFPVYQRHDPSCNAPWPLFMRLRQSAAGEGARALKDHQEWLESGYRAGDVLCQQVSEDNEYSIDVLMSLDSEPIYAVARQRCRVQGGECVEGFIADKAELCEATKALCVKLGLKGHNLVQAFCTDDNDIHFIEVNARYGGGSMMSIAAGMNTPAWLLRLAEADEDSLQSVIENLKMSKICYGMKLVVSKADPVNYLQADK